MLGVNTDTMRISDLIVIVVGKKGKSSCSFAAVAGEAQGVGAGLFVDAAPTSVAPSSTEALQTYGMRSRAIADIPTAFFAFPCVACYSAFRPLHFCGVPHVDHHCACR